LVRNRGQREKKKVMLNQFEPSGVIFKVLMKYFRSVSKEKLDTSGYTSAIAIGGKQFHSAGKKVIQKGRRNLGKRKKNLEDFIADCVGQRKASVISYRTNLGVV